MTAPWDRPPFRVDRRLVVGTDPARFWCTVADFERHPRWWPWLSFAGDRQPPVAPGSVLHAAIHPPGPYRLRLRLEVVEACAGSRLAMQVEGDLRGPASLELRPHEVDGVPATLVRVSWRFRPGRPLLAAVGAAARPLLHRGHRRVMDAGIAQFAGTTGLAVIEAPAGAWVPSTPPVARAR